MTGQERIARLANVWDKQARKDEGGQGYAVGCENINYRWKADALRSFLQRVRRGDSIADAAEATKLEAQEWVKRHNARRSKDIAWQRWVNCVDAEIESAARILYQEGVN